MATDNYTTLLDTIDNHVDIALVPTLLPKLERVGKAPTKENVKEVIKSVTEKQHEVTQESNSGSVRLLHVAIGGLVVAAVIVGIDYARMKKKYGDVYTIKDHFIRTLKLIAVGIKKLVAGVVKGVAKALLNLACTCIAICIVAAVLIKILPRPSRGSSWWWKAIYNYLRSKTKLSDEDIEQAKSPRRRPNIAL